MECPLCGEQIGEDDRIAAPKPKPSSDKSREELIGHRQCWYKEGFRDLTPNFHPQVAQDRTRSWLDRIEIDSVDEVKA